MEVPDAPSPPSDDEIVDQRLVVRATVLVPHRSALVKADLRCPSSNAPTRYAAKPIIKGNSHRSLKHAVACFGLIDPGMRVRMITAVFACVERIAECDCRR